MVCFPKRSEPFKPFEQEIVMRPHLFKPSLPALVVAIFALSACGEPAMASAASAAAEAQAASPVKSGSREALSTKASSSATAAATAAVPTIKLKGVNLSGAEYNAAKASGRIFTDYVYPNNAEIDYYKSKGMTALRLPFAGSRLQPVNNAALNTAELARIQNVVTYAAGKGMTVILDPHDYGKKYDSVSASMKTLGTENGLPAAYFADFWSRLATAFKTQPNVMFNLMNEPYQQTAAQWKAVAVPAITAIRAAGATQKILIPGTWYTGAHSWISSGNAAAWAGFTEPGNNFAFEMHQYLDSNSSGTSATCAVGKGAVALQQATAWARANKVQIFLGEVGWAQNAACMAEGAAIMAYTTANADVWLGWAYWAGGPWWPETYMFRLTPLSLTAPVDQPQMSTLQNNLQ